MSDARLRLALQRPGFTLDVDLPMPADGITALFGPSGSGKTTVLRCVAGLERARGSVRVAGETWQDDAQRVFLPPWRRAVGYVFQEASLFPHLSVRGNLAYAQRRAAGGPDIALDDVIALLGIGHLLDRNTHDLSGGERQRVAIARALATRPRLLLLDEPLAALDPARRGDVMPWLERLRDEVRLPMLYVTHSADEVARLADTVVLLEDGRVRAHGPLAATLARADLPFAREEEAAALLQGRIGAVDAHWHLARVDFDGGALWLRDDGVPTGRAVRVRVLARDVSIAIEPAQDGTTSIQNILPCTIAGLSASAHPSQVVVQLQAGGSVLLARITSRAADALRLAPGQRAWAQVKSAALVR
ncbi:molybdenum ABC transporter ATP-binding protein [Ramlibacter algicola]|uniref:Molybdenum ABC transporter ATP-binding protein n=1 Tax=Ramlibacter algicola TaxID=2795217 RepID=A0A934Q3I4_9BURK|nr:molybdenum ABC transporter ATP-binding protein [Ramlibacter algicola]MBK0394188.1 molybdenum ABC transporter ATP-binding protein [Ramlibacter algicola]